MTTTHTLDTFLQQDDEKEITTENKKEKLPPSLARFYARRFATFTLFGAALLVLATGLWLDASTADPFQFGGASAVMLLLFAAALPLTIIGIFGLAATGTATIHRNIIRNHR